MKEQTFFRETNAKYLVALMLCLKKLFFVLQNLKFISFNAKKQSLLLLCKSFLQKHFLVEIERPMPMPIPIQKKIETNTEVTIFYGKAKSKTFFNDCWIQQKKSFYQYHLIKVKTDYTAFQAQKVSEKINKVYLKQV
jgi:hypothetical protein